MSIKVKIENFQSIKDIEFDIDKYTVLTGPSNSGKSAICRAIEGALFNRSGDGFVRTGEKFAQVTLTTSTHEIVWTKGSGKNHYTINGEAYDKVGTDVPTVVFDMGFRDIELSRSKLRPQMGTDQFDILFLIREQGSLISELFSVLGRLDIITKAGKECSTDLKSRKSLLKTRYDDLTVVDRKLANYQGFEKVELASESLEAEHIEIKEAETELSQLSQLLSLKTECETGIDALQGVDKLPTPVDVDSKAIGQLKGLLAAQKALQSVERGISALAGVDQLETPELDSVKVFTLLKQLSQIQVKYQSVNSEISVLSPVQELGISADFDDKSIQDLTLLKKALKDILNLNTLISQESLEISALSEEIANYDSTLHELLYGLEECPLCNRALEGSYV